MKLIFFYLFIFCFLWKLEVIGLLLSFWFLILFFFFLYFIRFWKREIWQNYLIIWHNFKLVKFCCAIANIGLKSLIFGNRFKSWGMCDLKGNYIFCKCNNPRASFITDLRDTIACVCAFITWVLFIFLFK